MNKIEWSDKFSVGITILDEQHKQLIAMINLLIEIHNTASYSESITETLRSMTKYALTHFEDEEMFMVNYNYPDYTSHKEHHEEYKTKVVTFHSTNFDTTEGMSTNLLEYLQSWWTYHILEEDMKYKNFYDEQGFLVKVTSMV